MLSGVFQSTGWPVLVTILSNWWGKSRRGFIMGLWTSHTFAGNILGSLIAGYFVESNWGLSFHVVGFLILCCAFVVYLTLTSYPQSILQSSNGAKMDDDISCTDWKFNLVECKSVNDAYSNHDLNNSKASFKTLLIENDNRKPITLCQAILLPNVLSYSLLLFFAKLVACTLLYWLPHYLSSVETKPLSAKAAAELSVLFDVGGIIGGVLAGWLSDTNPSSLKSGTYDNNILYRRSLTCAFMFICSIPLLIFYYFEASATSITSLVLLTSCGIVINGPCALIIAAVSTDLGTQSALKDRTRALATITAIIDGLGSLGAALGPFLTGILVYYGWSAVFKMLILSNAIALAISLSIVWKCRGIQLNFDNSVPMT